MRFCATLQATRKLSYMRFGCTRLVSEKKFPVAVRLLSDLSEIPSHFT